MWSLLSQNCHARIWSFEYQDRCNFELKSSSVWVTTCGSLTRKGEQTAGATQLRTSAKPELHGSLWGNSSVPLSAGMSKWVKRRKMLRMNSQLWTVQLWTTESPLIGSRQWGRTETNIQIVLVVSTGHRERRDVLAPSLIFCFRNTSLYDTAHTRMYRHPHIHVTCKDIKAHTHSLCLFLLLCRKPWRMLICEHDISYITLTIGWRECSVVRSTHCSDR